MTGLHLSRSRHSLTRILTYYSDQRTSVNKSSTLVTKECDVKSVDLPLVFDHVLGFLSLKRTRTSTSITCEGTYNDLENRWLESTAREYIASYKPTYRY